MSNRINHGHGHAVSVAQPQHPPAAARPAVTPKKAASAPTDRYTPTQEKPGLLQRIFGRRHADAPTDLRQVQGELNQHLGIRLKQTGEMDAKTRAALTTFQKSRGLKVGDLDAGTMKALAAAPPKRADIPEGMRGLKSLQSVSRKEGSLQFQAGATICVDGRGASHGDPHYQSQTSLNLSGAKGRMRFPDADKTPYIALPPQVMRKYGIRVGDLAAVQYNNRKVAAVVADVGPGNKIGEVSRYAAQRLGIPDSPVSGGVGGGVNYTVYPGSRGNRAPSEADVHPNNLSVRLAMAEGGPQGFQFPKGMLAMR